MTRRLDADVGELGVALVEYEAADRHIAVDDGLAGESERRTEAQLVGNRLLPRVALGACLQSFDDDDPARRALAAAAAGVGEGDPGAQGCRQDRFTWPTLDESLIGEHVDVRHAAATLPRRRSADRPESSTRIRCSGTPTLISRSVATSAKPAERHT